MAPPTSAVPLGVPVLAEFLAMPPAFRCAQYIVPGLLGQSASVLCQQTRVCAESRDGALHTEMRGCCTVRHKTVHSKMSVPAAIHSLHRGASNHRVHRIIRAHLAVIIDLPARALTRHFSNLYVFPSSESRGKANPRLVRRPQGRAAAAPPLRSRPWCTQLQNVRAPQRAHNGEATFDNLVNMYLSCRRGADLWVPIVRHSLPWWRRQNQ